MWKLNKQENIDVKIMVENQRIQKQGVTESRQFKTQICFSHMKAAQQPPRKP